jgi:hypothetical protein
VWLEDILMAEVDNKLFIEEVNILENEEDVEEIDQAQISQAVLSATDWTTETILSQIDKGNILLNPKFQRREAWDQKRKSRFIESLFLGLPIPQIVLAESKDKKGSYIVIDGKQRLISIRQFAAKKGDTTYSTLKLSGLKIRRDLNKKSLEDVKRDLLSRESLSAFENQAIRTVVIKNWPAESFLYHVFLRLNTGSVTLSPQELRQALHPGLFIDFADTTSGKSPALREILNINKPDFRMRDVELLIRYYAFKYFLPNYSGQLKYFLDETCKVLNNEWNARKTALFNDAKEFELAFTAINAIFGKENSFRKWKGDRFENRFNRALFDVMMFYFSDPGFREVSLTKKDPILAAFKNLCVTDEKFVFSIERTTKSIESTYLRVFKWGQVLKDTTDYDGIHIPTLVNNRII